MIFKKQFTAVASLIIVVVAILWWTAAVWQGPLNSWTVSALNGIFKWQGYWSASLQGEQTLQNSGSQNLGGDIAQAQDKKILDAEIALLVLRAKIKKEKIGSVPAYLVAGRGADNFNVAVFEGEAPPVGAAVVSSEGFLVGRIISVAGSTALISSLTGVNFKLSARLLDQPNFSAVLQTDLSGLLRLFQLPREAVIKEKTIVESSAFDNVMPEGLAVASVKSLSIGAAGAPEAILLPLFSSVWSQPVLFEWKR